MAAVARNVLSRTFKPKFNAVSETAVFQSITIRQCYKLSRKCVSSFLTEGRRNSLLNDRFDIDLRNSTCVNSRRWYSNTRPERLCWKCGVNNRTYEELFFCNCGIVQKLPEDITYFEMLNSEETFNVDVDGLSQVYKHLQSRLHPDKFTLKSETEQDLAAKQSAFINKAYFTLVKPLSRGLYLLELSGDPLDETNNTVDVEFLAEMMEANEDIDEARSDVTELKILEEINNAKMEDCVKQVAEHFRTNNIAEAKFHLIRLKYFTNLSDKIKDIYRSHMD